MGLNIILYVKCIDPVPPAHPTTGTPSSRSLDLNRAPYVLYGVKYIDPVPPALTQDELPNGDDASILTVLNGIVSEYRDKLTTMQIRRLTFIVSASHLDLDRAPYVFYGVKYIDLVSLGDSHL